MASMENKKSLYGNSVLCYSVTIPTYLLKEYENANSKLSLYIYVYSSINHNS